MLPKDTVDILKEQQDLLNQLSKKVSQPEQKINITLAIVEIAKVLNT